jgi:hypothetical protein
MPYDLYTGGNYRGLAGFRGDLEGHYPTVEAAMERAAEIGDDLFVIYDGDRVVATGEGRYQRGPSGEVLGRTLEWTGEQVRAGRS